MKNSAGVRIDYKRVQILFLFFILPIAFSFILNIGLIFNIPNQLHSLDRIVQYLSSSRQNTISLSMLIGTTAIITIFFTLFPILYGLRFIPLKIIRKYILENLITGKFLSFQSGVIFVLVFFTIQTELYVINVVISILLLVISVFCNFLYFNWFTKLIVPENLILSMLNRIDFNLIDKKGHTFEKNYITFQQKIIGSKIVDKKEDYFEDLLFEKSTISIRSKKKGFLTNIKIDQINEIFSPIDDQIKKIGITCKIGQNIDSGNELLLIIPKFETTGNGEIKKSNINKTILEKESELINCFEFDTTISGYYEIANDILLIYENNLTSDVKVAQIFLKVISNWIYDKYNEISKSQISFPLLRTIVTTNILEIFLEKFEELPTEGIALLISDILDIFYHIQYLSLLIGEPAPLLSVFDSLNNIFRQRYLSANRYSFRLPIQILYIKELMFSYEMLKNFNKDKFEKIIKPIVLKGKEASIQAYLTFLRWPYVRPKDELDYYLKTNAQFLIDLLNSLVHWDEYFDIELDYAPKIKLRQWIVNLINSHGKNILYIAAVIFKMVQEGKLPKECISEISFQLANHCNNSGKYLGVKSENILDECFHSYDFNTPTTSAFSDWFEMNPIREAGAYTPAYYNFDSFWVSLSIYLKKKNQFFIPSEKPIKIDTYSKSQIADMIDGLKENFIQIIVPSFSTKELERMKEEYLLYLQNILKKIDNEKQNING